VTTLPCWTAILRTLGSLPVGRLRRSAILVVVGLLVSLPPATAFGDVRVTITGVNDTIAPNIRAMLDLVRHGGRDNLSEASIRRLFTRAPGQIRNAMRPFGFYQPQIVSNLEQRNGRWRASFEIDPGEPVRVTSIDALIKGEGSEEARLLQVIAESPMRIGRRLRHQEHDRLRNSLQNTARTLGYFDASFEVRRLEVDLADNTARVVLHLQTGPRYRIGAIQIDQDILNDSLLQRIVLIREGDPYSAAALLDAQHRLTDSLYFASVLVESGTPDQDTLTVPINIETVATRRQRIRTGAGYATNTGLRGSLRVDWRRLNDAGHSAATELRVSESLSELGAHYRIPIGDPIREQLLFRASLAREDLADLESRRATVGASHLTVQRGDWLRTIFTDLLEERTQVPGEPELRDLLVLPGISIEKLVANNLLFPTRGYRLRAEARGSHQQVGASTDFLRLEGEATGVISAGENWRFFARGAIGIGLVDDFANLPASQRFFSGGDLSVRGYSFNSLGPQDEAGNVIGGRHLVFGSLEAERVVWRRVALGAFVDTGNALDSFDTALETSVGVGLNVRTPIGTLRIGVARSVTESRDPRLHITIRPDL